MDTWIMIPLLYRLSYTATRQGGSSPFTSYLSISKGLKPLCPIPLLRVCCMIDHTHSFITPPAKFKPSSPTLKDGFNLLIIK